MDKVEVFLNQIANSKSIAIATHVNPDGDTLGSAVALKKFIDEYFKKDVTVLTCSEIPEVYSFLCETVEFKHCSKVDNSKVFDLMITVDVAAKDRMDMATCFFEKAKSTINIDHHITNLNFAAFNYVQPNACSTGEVLFSLIKQAKYKITKEIATGLYTAICTDTGNFKYSNTTPTVLKIAGELAECGVVPSQISNLVYSSKAKTMVMLTAYCINKAVFLEHNKIVYTTISQNEMQHYGAKHEHTEGIVESLREIKSTEIAILLKEVNENLTKVSMRTRTIDAALIASKFGGGGHKFAAGCVINKPLKVATDKLIEEVRKNLSI